MKLFVQSGPVTPDDEAQRLVEKHLRQFARPDTEITVSRIRYYSPSLARSRYATYLFTSQRIEAAMQAEREGYDAVAVLGTLDVGFFEIREVIEIPVVSITETSLHVATLLAHKVAFLANDRPFLERLYEITRLYGLHERLTPGGCLNLTADELRLALKNPGPVIEKLNTEAKRIAEQGADMLICANFLIPLLLIENGVTELGGIPVLNSLGVLIKVAEMMVDLHRMGINRAKTGLYAPLPKEELKRIRKDFG